MLSRERTKWEVMLSRETTNWEVMLSRATTNWEVMLDRETTKWELLLPRAYYINTALTSLREVEWYEEVERTPGRPDPLNLKNLNPKPKTLKP